MSAACPGAGACGANGSEVGVESDSVRASSGGGCWGASEDVEDDVGDKGDASDAEAEAS